MSDKDRRKKDGEDVQKHKQRFKEGSREDQRRAHESDVSTDQPDIMLHKPGSASDRTRVGAK